MNDKHVGGSGNQSEWDNYGKDPGTEDARQGPVDEDMASLWTNIQAWANRRHAERYGETPHGPGPKGPRKMSEKSVFDDDDDDDSSPSKKTHHGEPDTIHDWRPSGLDKLDSAFRKPLRPDPNGPQKMSEKGQPRVDPTTYRDQIDEGSDREQEPGEAGEDEKDFHRAQGRVFHGKEPSRNARESSGKRCPHCGKAIEDREDEEVLRKAEGPAPGPKSPQKPGLRISAPTASGLKGYKSPPKKQAEVEAGFRTGSFEGQGGRIPKARIELLDPTHPRVRCRRQLTSIALVARALNITGQAVKAALARGHSLAHPDIPGAVFRMARPTKVVATADGIREAVSRMKTPKHPLAHDEVNLGELASNHGLAGDVPAGGNWWDPDVPTKKPAKEARGRLDRPFPGRPAKKGTKRAVEG